MLCGCVYLNILGNQSWLKNLSVVVTPAALVVLIYSVKNIFGMLHSLALLQIVLYFFGGGFVFLTGLHTMLAVVEKCEKEISVPGGMK